MPIPSRTYAITHTLSLSNATPRWVCHLRHGISCATISVSPRIPITRARNDYPLDLQSPRQIYTAPDEETRTRKLPAETLSRSGWLAFNCSGNRPARSCASSAQSLHSVDAARAFLLNLSLLLRWKGRHHSWLAVVLVYTHTLSRRVL